MLDILNDSESIKTHGWLTNDKDAIKEHSKQFTDKDEQDSSLLFNAIEKIGYTKEDIEFTEDTGWYNSFFINNAFSQHIDTALYAFEMNIRPDMPNEWHYHYLKNSIKAYKRRGKWAKLEDDVEKILLTYVFAKSQDINRDKAKEYIDTMPKQFIDDFKRRNKAIALTDADMVLKRFPKKEINKAKKAVKDNW
ncbi:MAG: hypothetical protein CL489_08300 [Acidobacteria bacterium]|nr:hypothetical protein [Acidobacteriota bacterium]|tara:strand:+ start:20964 stop:21542 length:579 start_codon:yes stop_codon:yes gene_type:complete